MQLPRSCKAWLMTTSIVCLLRSICHCIEFPNTIEGLPEIYCGEMEIELSVTTTAGNPSHMFVIGRHEEPDCVTRNDNKITIKHETCGVLRERSLNPAGIMYRMCVSVQLHPQFITKVDKTFCARCFYTEGVNELTRELEVSPQSSIEVPVSFDAPTCTYSIRKGSPTGEEVRYAVVGEPVYHVWHCPSEMNGMLVQNCYVEDGQGNRILIIDQNGCGIDQYVMQTPNYTRDLTMSFQESHVFKFADKTITRFTCQIKICIKANDGCVGITVCYDSRFFLKNISVLLLLLFNYNRPPENCPESPGPGLPLQSYRNRFSRSADAAGNLQFAVMAAQALQQNQTVRSNRQSSFNDAFELDVSDEIIVLDDPPNDFESQLPDYVRQRVAPTLNISTEIDTDRICVARHGAALLLVISSAFGLFGVILVIYLLKLTRRHKPL